MTELEEKKHKLQLLMKESDIDAMKGYLYQAFRLMFEGTETDRRMYLTRIARGIPELEELSKKYPYQGSILRGE